jgi:hypothetical protein
MAIVQVNLSKTAICLMESINTGYPFPQVRWTRLIKRQGLLYSYPIYLFPTLYTLESKKARISNSSLGPASLWGPGKWYFIQIWISKAKLRCA